MPQGVVYTTFHHPVSGANVVTTEHSDWATNCPEYKVTAVQVTPRHHAQPRSRLDHPEHRLGALVRMANQIARQFVRTVAGDSPSRPSQRTSIGFWEHDMLPTSRRALEQGTVTVDAAVIEAINSIGVDDPPLPSGVGAS